MRKTTWVLIVIAFVSVAAVKFSPGPKPYPFPKLGYFPPMPVAEDNIPTVEGVALGRFLFYDPILSADSTFSCGSCHHQSKAFSDAPNRFSEGLNGELMSRNTLPLFNLAWYPGLFWDGAASTPEDQVFHPVAAHAEMNLEWALAEERVGRSSFYQPKFAAAFGEVPIDSTHIAKAIAQFERTLISYNSKYDKVLRGEARFTKAEYNGFVIVNDQSMGDCMHCHVTDGHALGTNARYANNGLDMALTPADYLDPGRMTVTGNPDDAGRFKTPTLRNIALTAPYMHDGRFKTLEEVIDFYSSGVHAGINTDSKMTRAREGGVHLTENEKSDVLSFLYTLTDSVFIANPEFGNPFDENERRHR